MPRDQRIDGRIWTLRSHRRGVRASHLLPQARQLQRQDSQYAADQSHYRVGLREHAGLDEVAVATGPAGDTESFIWDDNHAADAALLHRASARASLACAAIDQSAPDALNLDCPLKLKDVVFACLRRRRFGMKFARRDPAFGDWIVPFAEIDHARSPLPILAIPLMSALSPCAGYWCSG